MVTLVSESSYPNDIEIKTLLPEPHVISLNGEIKLGFKNTALTLNYSFSNANTFVMNDSYAEDFLEYEMDPVAINNLLSTPGYELQSFSPTEKNVTSSIMHFKIGVTHLELLLLKLMKLIQTMVKLDFIYWILIFGKM